VATVEFRTVLLRLFTWFCYIMVDLRTTMKLTIRHFMHVRQAIASTNNYFVYHYGRLSFA